MAAAVNGMHIFAGDVGPEALSLLDLNYGNLVMGCNFLNNFTNYYVDSGTPDAVVVTTSLPQLAALLPGLALQVKMAATNLTQTPTLNLNGGGANTIGDINGFVIQPGQLHVGISYSFIYNGSVWCCQNYNNFSATSQLTLTKTKTSTTARANTVVHANDPDLQIVIPFASRWAIEVQVIAWCQNTGAQGFSGGLWYNGGFTSPGTNGLLCSYGTAGWGIFSASQLMGTTVTGNSGAQSSGSAMSASSSTPDALRMSAVLISTGTGTLAFSWSQSTTNANATNLALGSWMTATSIS